MNKKLLLSYLVSWLVGGYLISQLIGTAIAQTKTLSASSDATASPSVTIDPAIEQLKNKIANTVSQIRKENNKAVSGFVVNIDGNSMKINNNGVENTVKFDDTLTKYFQILATQKKEIKASDIKKNDYAIVSGVQTDSTITANTVFIDENLVVDSGKITSVDSSNYDIKVTTTDKTDYTLSIETYTKQSMLNIKTLTLDRIGFSKIKEGDTVHFVVKKTGQEKNNNYPALKILIIPQEYFIK